MTPGRTSQSTPPPKVLHKQGFNKGLFSWPFIATYCYAFLAAGGAWVDLPVDGSSAGGETTSRSDIELVARLLERRRLGKKGTCHCEFCLIKLIYNLKDVMSLEMLAPVEKNIIYQDCANEMTW